MTRSMKIVIAALIAGAFLTAGQGAYAFDKEGKNGPDQEKKHEEMFDKMTKDLNLTADQQAKLKANKEAQRAKMTQLREAMKANRAKFKEAVNKPGVTRASLEPVIAETKALESQMVDQRVDSILAIKAILTPEQFEKMHKGFEEKQKERGERAKKWEKE